MVGATIQTGSEGMPSSSAPPVLLLLLLLVALLLLLLLVVVVVVVVVVVAVVVVVVVVLRLFVWGSRNAKLRQTDSFAVARTNNFTKYQSRSKEQTYYN